MENDKINVLSMPLEKHFPVKNVLEFMKFVLEKVLFFKKVLEMSLNFTFENP